LESNGRRHLPRRPTVGKKSARRDTKRGVRTEIRPSEPTGDAPQKPGEVVDWREQQLRAAGFEQALARKLAGDCAVDLHALIELVERGCPPDLAARILAPLAEERKPC
jgi:hypothetical protein